MNQKSNLLYRWTSLIIFINLHSCSYSAFIPYAPCGKNALEPCSNVPSFPGSIICENIQDLRTFVQVLRCNRMKNMQEVFLVKSFIDYLPIYILDFCDFQLLNLKNVIMNKLLDGSDMTHLQQLHLDNVTILSPWNWEPFAIMTRLIKFSVVNMIVRVLDMSLLDHLNNNLQSFILTSTNTTLIGKYAFQRFKNLAYISIQKNEIYELRRSMFSRPAKIKYFYFGKNKIVSLPEDMFHDMPELEIVAVEGNLISELHEQIFKKIWNNLSYVLLEGNPLKCSCKMLWLAKRFTPDVFRGECYAPKTNFGKALKDLQVADFHCY